MPALANIIINDGATTPVAKTFEPTSKEADGTVVFEERSGGIPLGNPKIVFKRSAPSLDAKSSTSDRVYRVTYSIMVPTLEVTAPTTATGIQPAPTISYVERAKLEFIVPERSSLQDRKHIRAYAKNLLAHTVLTDTLEALSAFYG